MRKIVKTRQPREWTRYCCTPGVDYQACPELRKVLLNDQGYICAYCTRSLDEMGNNTKIEHIKTRNKNQYQKLKYRNMVICCNGVTKGFRHCDTSKDRDDISFDLLTDSFFKTLSYGSGSGIIKSSNATWDDEINRLLHLNNDYLRHERIEIINSIIEVLGKKEDWNTEKQKLRRLRKIWNEKDARGHYKPYCGLVVYFLTKRLDRANKN